MVSPHKVMKTYLTIWTTLNASSVSSNPSLNTTKKLIKKKSSRGGVRFLFSFNLRNRLIPEVSLASAHHLIIMTSSS